MKSHLAAVTFLVLFGCAVSTPKQGVPQNNVPPRGDPSPYAKDPICQRSGNTAVTEAELDSEFAQARARNTEDAYRNFVFCHRANEKHYNEAVARLDEVLHSSTTTPPTQGASQTPSAAAQQPAYQRPNRDGPPAAAQICQRSGNTAVTEAELDSEFAQARARNTEDAYRNFVFCHRANEKHYNEAVARLDEVLHSSTTTTGSSSSPSLGTTVQVEDSQFESSVTFQGIKERYPGNQFNSYLLRSWVNKTSNQAKHQLYVSNYYNGSWVLWVGANSQDAQPLEFVSISRDVIFCGSYTGCSYSEQFGATISDTMLKTHQDSFSVKFYAKTGEEMVITLTSQQIRQQLKAIEDFQASNKR